MHRGGEGGGGEAYGAPGTGDITEADGVSAQEWVLWDPGQPFWGKAPTLSTEHEKRLRSNKSWQKARGDQVAAAGKPFLQRLCGPAPLEARVAKALGVQGQKTTPKRGERHPTPRRSSKPERLHPGCTGEPRTHLPCPRERQACSRG